MAGSRGNDEDSVMSNDVRKEMRKEGCDTKITVDGLTF